MAVTVTINADGSGTLNDGVHPAKNFTFIDGGQGRLSVLVSGDNVPPGQTPIRFKLSNSGGRVAADEPGVDPNTFIVDSNNVITNG